jgi:tetratricopeptide (TPR) repeat protein
MLRRLRVGPVLTAALALAAVAAAAGARADEARGRALCVGVNRYDAFAGLRFAGRDAADLGRVLAAEFGLHVRVMTEERAKAEPADAPDVRRVRAALRRLAEECEEGDTVVFVFSGHGRGGDDGTEVSLALADTDPDDPESSLPLSEVYRALAACPAGQKLIILDACRRVSTGDRVEEARPDRPEPLVRVEVPPPPEGIVVLLSCDGDEVSVETSVLGHGVFTHYLLRELKAAADRVEPTTASALVEAIAGPTAALARLRIGEPQTPQRLAEDGAEVVLRPPASGHLRRGLGLSTEGRYLEAEGAFTAGLEESPGVPRLLAERALARVNRSDVAGAIADADAALAEAPDYPPALAARAYARAYRSDFAAALADARRALEVDPSCALAYCARAYTHMWLDELNQALDDAERAARLAPDAYLPLLERARVLSSLFQGDRAEADARRLVEQRPGSVEARVLLSDILEGRIDRAALEAMLREAAALADAQIGRDPDDQWVRQARAACLRRLRDYEAAEAEVAAALERTPADPTWLSERGRIELHSGRPGEAAATFAEVARLTPQDSYPLYLRAVALESDDRPEAARADVEAGLKLSPRSPLLLRERSDLTRGDDPAAAKLDQDRAVALYPQAWYGYYERSFLDLALGDPDGALADLDTAARLAPYDPSPLIRRGLVYSTLGRQDEALADFDRALEITPKAADVFAARGWSLLAIKQYPEAAADFRAALGLDPEDPDLHEGLGTALYRLGEYPEAVAELTAAIDRHDQAPDAFLYRGLAEMLLGDIAPDDLLRDDLRPRDDEEGTSYFALMFLSSVSREAELFDSLIRSDPENFLYYALRSRVHRNAGRYDEALANADAVGKLAPKAPLGHVLRALALAGRGDLGDAVAELDEAVALAPDRAALYLRRATLERDLGDAEKARADLDTAVSLDPEDADAVAVRGQLRLAAGDDEGAVADLSRAIELDPDDAQYYADRAVAYFRLEDPEPSERVVADLDRAIELEPEDASTLGFRALVKKERGDHDGAVADYARVVELSPEDATARLDLGLARIAKGEEEQAVADLAAGIGLDPGLPALYAARSLARARLGELDAAVDDARKADELGGAEDDWSAFLARTLVRRSRDRLALGRPEEALADADAAIAEAPGMADARLARGDARRAGGRLDEAAAAYGEAIDLGGEAEALGLARLALLDAGRGDMDAAAASLDRLFDLDVAIDADGWDEDDPGVRLARAGVAYGTDVPEADLDAQLASALDAEPGLAYLHWRRGKLNRSIDLDVAIDEYTRALDGGFDRADVRTDRAFAYNERAGDGDASLALADAERALESDPGRPEGHLEKAYALLMLGRDEEAVAAAGEAIRVAPGRSGGYRYRARALDHLGRLDEAEADYARALEVDPGERVALAERADLRMRRGRFADAEADLSALIALDAEDAGARIDRARARIELGRLDDAEADLDEAEELDPEGPDVAANRGRLELRRKNFGLARAHLDDALGRDPADADALRLRAEAFEALGEPDRAADDLRAADELDAPADPD